MIEFSKIKLSSYVLFDSLDMDIRKGLTVINGRNLDSESGRSNGCGKSLLVSCIPNILFGLTTPVTSVRSRSKKDAFHRKESSASIELKDSDIYTIKKFNKGSSLKYEILKNRKNMDFTTATAAEKWIQDYFPVSEEMFFQTAYLDSRRPNTLLSGSGAARLNYFSSLFSLDIYDNVKSHFMEMRKNLDSVLLKKSILEEEIEESENQIKILKEKIKGKDEIWVKKQNKTVARISEEKFRVASALPVVKKLEKAESIKYDSQEYESLRKEIPVLKKLEKSLMEYKKWKKIHEKYRIEKASLEKELKLYKNGDRNSIRDRMDSLSKNLEFLEKNTKRFEYLKKSIKKEPEKISQKKMVALQASLQTSCDYMKKLEKMKDKGECPVCGNKIDKNHTDREISSIESSIEKNRQTLKILSDKFHVYEKYQQHLGEYNLLLEKMPEKQFSQLKKSLSDCKEKLSDIDRHENIVSKLSRLGKPVGVSKPDTDKSLEEIRSEIDSRESRLEILMVAQSTDKSLESLANLGFRNTGDVLKLEKSVRDKNPAKMQGKIQQITVMTDRKKNLEDSLKRKKEELKSCSKKLRNISTLDTLVKAYSNTGLKRFACASIAKSVENNINNLVPLVFDSGNFRFILDVTDTDFRIMYEDSRGRFDVRNLSGAESRLFCILSMLGILPLLPSHKRMNILVLDEMTVNLDAVNTDRFINGLIPRMLEIIPSIIMVSNEPVTLPDARQLTVEKNGNTSILVEE